MSRSKSSRSGREREAAIENAEKRMNQARRDERLAHETVKATDTPDARRAYIEAARQADAAARTKTCPHCGNQYLARRKDQTNCLAPACRKAAALAWGKSHDLEKALPAAPKASAVPAAPVSRVDRIKAVAARMDGLPENARAAAAEARESEEL